MTNRTNTANADKSSIALCACKVKRDVKFPTYRRGPRAKGMIISGPTTSKQCNEVSILFASRPEMEE
jgi:hypothetical protein